MAGEITVRNPGFHSISDGGGITFEISGAKGSSELEIYTINGKLVKSIPVAAGEGSVDWDVANTEGNTIADGIYIYSVMDSEGNKKTGKLAVGQ